jgi:hypothetical protein
MTQRVKGSETRVTVTGPNGIEEGLTDIRSFEFGYERVVTEEGYLGEASDRYDDIYKGISFRFELHLEDQGAFQFVERVNARSQRRTAADEVFNVVTTLDFPNGERPRVNIQDCFFGTLPVAVGGREEYVTMTVEGKAQFARTLF